MPRPKYNSDFLFKNVRKFIKNGGIERMLAVLEEKNNGDLLSAYITAIGNLACNLHRSLITELIPRLKSIIHRHLTDESELIIKSLTKEKYEYIFAAMKNLCKRSTLFINLS